MYSVYYQARVERTKCWFLVGALRSFEHVAFDRTLDAHESIFEFFVPPDMEGYFLEIMRYFQDAKIVTSLERLPNRVISQPLF